MFPAHGATSASPVGEDQAVVVAGGLGHEAVRELLPRLGVQGRRRYLSWLIAVMSSTKENTHLPEAVTIPTSPLTWW